MPILTCGQLKLLLNETESSSLDFKQVQYKFIGAEDEEKGELLKDILAFANFFRRTDAYILTGVTEDKEIIGITEDIDDAQLQQFVNSKTQRQVHFLYYAVQCDHKKVGVIHIPIQPRPLYLLKDFGRLKKGAVYLRRGSSTSEATPDEIAQMGSQFESNQEFKPSLEVLFGNGLQAFKIRTSSLKRIMTDKVTLLDAYKKKYPLLEIPTIENQDNLSEMLQAMVAPFASLLQEASPENYNNYLKKCYDDYNKYLDALQEYEDNNGYIIECPLILKNTGNAPAEDVDVFLHFPDGLNLYKRRDVPKKPEEPPEPMPQSDFAAKQFDFLNPSIHFPLSIPHAGPLNVPPPNVSSPGIKKTHSYEVDFSVKKVKHNQFEELSGLFTDIGRDNKPRSFQIDYRINAYNVPNEIYGQISIEICD